jgi:hypothetical protein
MAWSTNATASDTQFSTAVLLDMMGKTPDFLIPGDAARPVNTDDKANSANLCAQKMTLAQN